jgi:3-deoxy-D-manno-octulosonic-acid transferase
VVVGPHDYNFAEAVQLAVAGGAAVQVGSVGEALAVARELIADPDRFQRMADCGREFVRRHAGTAQRMLGLIKIRA